MIDVTASLIDVLKTINPWEAVAVISAIAYVWLAANQHIWCWPAAFLSTAIYVVLFWEVTLPFHAILNVYYMMMAIYGLLKWRKNAVSSVNIHRWPLHRHIIWCLALVLVSIALSRLASTYFDESYLLLDATITVFGVYTTVLVAHKVIENWIYWIVINSVASWLYFAKGLPLTSLLYVAYVLFAIYGYRQWVKDERTYAANTTV